MLAKPLECRSKHLKSDDEVFQDSSLVFLFRLLFQDMPSVSNMDKAALSVAGIVSVLSLLGIGRLMQRRAFEMRNFTSRIQISLNSVKQIEEGKYKLIRRTLREVNVKSLMPIASGVDVLVSAGIFV